MNEFEILQNPIAGAHILHEFMKTYVDSDNNEIPPKGIKLPFIFMILPIVFSKDYVEDISPKNFKFGSLLKSLNNEQLYWSNLSTKMSDYSILTFSSLNIAFSSLLLGYDKSSTNVYPVLDANILNKNTLNKDYKEMLSTATRLGHWLRDLSDDEICSYFNLSY